MSNLIYAFIVLELIVILILRLKQRKEKEFYLKEIDKLKVKSSQGQAEIATLDDYLNIRRKVLQNDKFIKSFPKTYNIPIEDFYVFIGVNFKKPPGVMRYNDNDFDIGAFLLNEDHQLSDSKNFIYYNNPLNNGVYLGEEIIGPNDFGHDLSSVGNYDLGDFLYVNLKEVPSDINTIVLSCFLPLKNEEVFTNILDINLLIWNRWNHNYRFGNLFSCKQNTIGASTNCFEVGAIVRNSDNTWKLNINIEETELGIAGIASKYVQSNPPNNIF